MLRLKNITKNYKVAGGEIEVLKGLNVSFRKNEFVSILGPSGCGKTTTLNIIGGLDKYTSGDLIIAGKSTKNFKDRDWDVYRNQRIGFIFQSYNLIPHQTVLGNVELALTISGINKEERVKRALRALEKVGLKGEEHKRPNQLSGGQCQRVAIARALVNEPDILLADEPTGALDSKTSVQIMDLIKEISKDKLVIMVTHNADIAEEYSNRIIRLIDGQIIEDTNPMTEEDEIKETEGLVSHKVEKKSKAKMSRLTAFKLSARNLFTKRGRTLLTSIAGSIGIIGISAVIAVSAGVRGYIADMQDDMLSGNPITVQETALDFSSMMENLTPEQKIEMVKVEGHVNVDKMVDYLAKQYKAVDTLLAENDIKQEYVDYVKSMPSEYGTLKLDYGIDVTNNIYTNFNQNAEQTRDVSLSSIKQIYTGVIGKTSLADQAPVIASLGDTFMQAPDSKDYILSQYKLLDGRVAEKKDEIMIVVSKDTALTDLLLAQLGYYTQDEFMSIVNKAADTEGYENASTKERFTYSELTQKEFVWYDNDTVFGAKMSYEVPNQTGGTTKYTNYAYNYDSEKFTQEQKDAGLKLKVVGILQPQDDINYGCLTSGVYYTSALAEHVIEKNFDSQIAEDFRIAEEEGSNTTTFANYTYTFKYDTDNDGVLEDYMGNAQVGKYNTMISMFTGGTPYYQLTARHLGGNKIVNDISIYPADFEKKDLVTAYLDKWNEKGDITVNGVKYTFDDRVETNYTDTLSLIIFMINSMIDVVTIALVSFTSLALVVSCVMISIVTYVSVVERVKEIGVIRSLGGRKKDVSNLFNAETFILGLGSGLIGVGFTYLLSLIVNIIVKNAAGFAIMTLKPMSALIMILLSVGLTVLSGLIPSKKAAKQDPVVALRTE